MSLGAAPYTTQPFPVNAGSTALPAPPSPPAPSCPTALSASSELLTLSLVCPSGSGGSVNVCRESDIRQALAYTGFKLGSDPALKTESTLSRPQLTWGAILEMMGSSIWNIYLIRKIIYKHAREQWAGQIPREKCVLDGRCVPCSCIRMKRTDVPANETYDVPAASYSLGLPAPHSQARLG